MGSEDESNSLSDNSPYDSADDEIESEESDKANNVEESDSSEDEVGPRNTIGDVPLEWYKDEEHIGYDIAGRKIRKQPRKSRIDTFLDNEWRKIYDESEDEDVELTKEEIKQIRKILKGLTPHAGVDPFPPYVDFVEWEDKGHPLSNAPEPKRRFIPSKWEHKKVVKLVRAIRKGLYNNAKQKEERKPYLLWGDDLGTADKRHGFNYIPAPKPKLPGHEESYNPSVEFIPTQEEINSYQLMYEEDRPKFIPRKFNSLRSVPAYEKSSKEIFDRCLDLYLCPRTRRKRINIDPELLKPKLPNKKDLRPYPTTCYLEFKGHNGSVKCLSVHASGQWIASGSSDGEIRVWEVETARCLKIWNVNGTSVKHIAWNPSSEVHILAAVLDHDVLLLDTGLCGPEAQTRTNKLLSLEPKQPENDGDENLPVKWTNHEKISGIMLKHFKAVSTVEWHYKGDQFTTVLPHGDTKAVLLHQLSTRESRHPFHKLKGPVVSAAYHPSKKFFFVATEKYIVVYDFVRKQLVKKLQPRLKQISSFSIHPGGDNIIVGSREGKLCWFDLDLSSTPYKQLKAHTKDINNVIFHKKYPLFASCSEDLTSYVFHGKVFSDLNTNPLIVPLEILRGHKSSNYGGVLDCKFHPTQPWLFTAGADSIIRLYCH